MTAGGAEETRFTDLTGTALIKQGVLTNNNLQLLSPRFQAKGEGKVNLVKEKLNYTVSIARPEKADGQSDRTFIPLKIHGPFAELDYDLKLDEVIKQEAKKEAKKKLEKELGGTVDEQVEEFREKLQDKLKLPF